MAPAVKKRERSANMGPVEMVREACNKVGGPRLSYEQPLREVAVELCDELRRLQNDIGGW